MVASSDGRQEIVAVLLEYRAQVNLVDEVRHTLRCKTVICPYIVNYK